MIKINRLRIVIVTDRGDYGFDERFNYGLNFLASDDNTCGKSSVIEAIYYGLGFEQIIGGVGEKVLTSAYKTYIEVEEEKLPVIESHIYLEVSNGAECVTVYRAAKDVKRDSKLVTVFYSSMDKMYEKETLSEDMYVHSPNSAVNQKGFHAFLEKFLHLELPIVPASDGNQRKLYLQLIFSCMFIEQKHGWGDIFSGIPFLGIKDSKKRVLEFVLNLDTINTEKKKEQIKFEEARIKSEWNLATKEIHNAVSRETCSIAGVLPNPCEFTEILARGVLVYKEEVELSEYVAKLREEYEKLETVQPKVVDNFDEMQDELDETESLIEKFESEMQSLRVERTKENAAIVILDNNLEVIATDLQNNKDAAKLRNLGSQIGARVFDDICPVCNQVITDSLLPPVEGMEVMSIDENIRHLEAQKIMLSYARECHCGNRKAIDERIQMLQSKIVSLRRLAMALRTDLYSVDDNMSEAIVYKKIDLLNRIERLENLQQYVMLRVNTLLELGKSWTKLLEDKRSVPKNKFSNIDLDKLNALEGYFVENLRKYGYKSVANLDVIQISEESYLPVIEEFDMKFDSSASDNIRAIWAYTIALMQVSMKKKGNHPCALIFDEPNQHSIIPKDMQEFFDSIISLGDAVQIIVGITVKDTDTKNEIEKLPRDKYTVIPVANKAFQKLENI